MAVNSSLSCMCFKACGWSGLVVRVYKKDWPFTEVLKSLLGIRDSPLCSNHNFSLRRHSCAMCIIHTTMKKTAILNMSIA